MRRYCGGWLGVAASAVLSVATGGAAAFAGGGPTQHEVHQKGDDCVTYQTVERVVYKSVMVPEQRTITTTVYHPEVREKTVNICKYVPETSQVTQTCTVMVPKTHTKTVSYTVAKPIYEDVQETCTVMVPHSELKKGMRTVCKMVPVTMTRTMVKDMGHWECVTQCVPCGHGYMNVTRKVWCAKPVQVHVPVTVMKPHYEQQEYSFMTTSYRPEQRVYTRRVCKYVPETHKKDVLCTVMVPEQRERVVHVTNYKQVIEPHIQKYTLMVPEHVQKTITVMTCKVVPETVVSKVPVVTCDHCY